ncbi:hypothetical protein GOP47_0000875 [Adiantum capillus-veneris]|uniref:Fe2OG dioxygenase domain-containing protein n=1 Tax=Adiantum capillus-veneris TaxID=13818 RepID=A0A9D4VDT6_ADICA|nr:hypothetical protein GOP47_0000875 [Adiantum capillus-veneris]
MACAVIGLQEMIETSAERAGQLQAVPDAFIRPPHDRSPSLVQEQQLPVIDISDLHDPHLRPLVLQHISHACAHWGFFQVVNHGVKDEVIQEMRAACWRFFNQPASERNKFKGQENELPVGYATSFNPAVEIARDWKDVLYVRDVPGMCSNGFNLLPEICREAFQQYRSGVDELAKLLFESIFEGLGVSIASIKVKVPPAAQLVMGVNFYPPCPDPSLTYGISPHSDVGYVTVLLQDEVPGLQIKKGENWYLVKPLPNAFVINLADQIEILSNGKYKSIEHRAVTNTDKPRMSIACFYGPLNSAIIAPLTDFTSENEPARYNAVKYGDYVRNFYSKGLLPDRATLNLAR